MNDEVKFDIYRPFGPNVLRTGLPGGMTAHINALADETLGSEEQRRKHDWSQKLAGNVKHEVRIEPTKVSGLAEFMVDMTKVYLENSLGKLPNVAEVELSVWVVSQYAGDFNPIHTHGSNISGVAFLKMPPGFEEEYAREDHHPTVGCLELLGAMPNSYSEHSYVIKPAVGDVYMFPSWLTHQVYPFRSAGERRSMAFNVTLIPAGK
jgi:hypothetical protein